MNNPLFNNNRFTHLLPQDIEVWKRFLDSPANNYDFFEYDIRVGEGRDPGNDFDDNRRSHAIKLSQRRIDAIGHHKDHLAIFEITRYAGLKALGQLIAYPILYKSKFAPSLPLVPILIAEELQTDVEIPYHMNKIKVLLYK